MTMPTDAEIMQAIISYTAHGARWGVEDFLACFPGLPADGTADRTVVDRALVLISGTSRWQYVREQLQNFVAGGYEL